MVFLGRCCKSWKLLSRAGRELDFFRVLALRGNVFFGFLQHLSNASAVFSLASSSLRCCDLPNIASHARRGARKNMLLAQRGNANPAFCDTSAAGVAFFDTAASILKGSAAEVLVHACGSLWCFLCHLPRRSWLFCHLRSPLILQRCRASLS